MEQRRWISLIKPSIQLKLLFILLLTVFINLVIAGGLLWYIIDRVMVEYALNHTLVDVITGEMVFAGVVCAFFVLLTTVVFSFLFLRECNRVVGPIYRVTSELNKIHETGDVTPISVRSEDHFQDMVKNLNLVLLDIAKKQE